MSEDLHLGVVVWTPEAENLIERTGTDLANLLTRHAAGTGSRDDEFSRVSVFVVDPVREEIDGSVYVVTNRLEGYTTVCLPREY